MRTLARVIFGIAATGVALVGFAAGEALLRRRYVRLIASLDVPQDAHEDIITYPLA